MTDQSEVTYDLKKGYLGEPPSPRISIQNLRLSLDQTFPIDVDFATQIAQFISNGIFKSIENPGLHDKVFSVLKDKRISKICLIVMQIVLITKYPHTLKSPTLLTSMKLKLSKTYVKFFSSLPQPKDEVINYIIFLCGYNVHWMLWRIAKDSREEMDLRFVFDVYHILVFSLNGIYVSDSYIRVQIEKVFSSRFMEYEREKKEKLIMLKIEKRKKNNERTFLGKKIDFPDVSRCSGGSEFTKMLNDKFKVKGKQVYDETTTQAVIDTKFNLHSTVSQVDNLVTKHSDEFQMNKQEVKLLLQNLQLNVNQISPTIFHVLQMNQMQLPFSRKKMLSHTFEKNDDKTQGILNLLKEMTNQRKMKKDQKQTKKYVQNLIEIYDLRAPVKEYFQKHTKVDPMFKDMLELNYVLTHQQESLNSLYSTKELHRNLEEDNVDETNQQDPKLLVSPQKRLIAYLQSKQQTIQVQKVISIDSGTPYLLSDNKLMKSTVFPSIQQQTLTNQADTIKQFAQGKKTMDNMRNDDVFNNDLLFQPYVKLKYTSQVKIIKDQEDQIYQDKKKFYKNKYDQILNCESTDSKIDSIVQNLQIKQNLISKSLSKRIHKL